MRYAWISAAEVPPVETVELTDEGAPGLEDEAAPVAFGETWLSNRQDLSIWDYPMVKKLVNIHGSVPSRVSLTSRRSCASKDGRQEEKKEGDGTESELKHWKQRNVLCKKERKVNYEYVNFAGRLFSFIYTDSILTLVLMSCLS